MRQYDRQKNRGQAGFGIFDGVQQRLVRTPKERKIMSWLKKYDSNILMFHHRFPTSTINVAQAAHPHSTQKYFGKDKFVLVHNGVLYNAHALKKEHEALGIKYFSQLADGTFNDSEALLWDVSLYMQGFQDELKAEGTIAFAMMHTENGELKKLYFGRNTGNPLRMRYDSEHLELASEGFGDNIGSNLLHIYDYESEALTVTPLDIPLYRSTPAYSFGTEEEYESWKSRNLQLQTGGDVKPSATETDDQTTAAVAKAIDEALASEDNPDEFIDLTTEPEEEEGDERSFGYYPQEYIHDPNTQEMRPLVGASNPFRGPVQDNPYTNTDNDTPDLARMATIGFLAASHHVEGRAIIVPKPFEAKDIKSIPEAELVLDGSDFVEEIETCKATYLRQAFGHFETAYWNMEDDYQDLQVVMLKNPTADERLSSFILECAMKSVEHDPENTTINSVSSDYAPINQA
jgi:hypothetical protein